MVGHLRPPAAARSSMRPPPRPHASHLAFLTGRAQSPADSSAAGGGHAVVGGGGGGGGGGGTKRKERDFDQDGGEESNIYVVVRCRGRSEREVRENSGVVVSTNGVKGKTVELSMGPNAISNKSYHFDKVFSPAADQAIVFDDVVAPILTEMLTGYNCTIFAYGQTGTGKTYTMSGDMTETFGLLSDAAGIIPRVLHALFQKLEADDAECAVKCSFIELYNEDLRDLLSAEDHVKLKIYDDASRKTHTATLVQGMAETHIKDATAGIRLLQQGSYRRQVAATKCNDLSSRGHTVFTITTYVKRAAGDGGDEYICAGKLNLVDLAGSENIQRSGAENKRAVEAGLINKSLLTLGRVINALVDKSAHIPYRESKLTRLLQDSLGGRTKTCIIATVSPARSNLDETISTLDYAFRAKNIRNKPHVNSMISKKTLLKEYTTEIEKLKSELIATRQRNGVYLTNDQYEEITVESESRRILSEEQKARIETMEVSLRHKVQELFNLTNNFTNLKRDNDSTRGSLESAKDVLSKTQQTLAATQTSLEDETALRQAHEATEGRLLGVGTELMATVDVSLRDVQGLHTKLKRRSVLHAENRDRWQASVENVTTVAQLVDGHIGAFHQAHADLLAASSTRIQDFLSAERSRLEASAQLALAKAADFDDACADVDHRSAAARDTMNDVLEEIKAVRDDVKHKVGDGLQSLSQAAATISAEVIAELEHFHTQLHTCYSGLGKDVKTMFEDLTRQLAVQREEVDALRAALEDANRANIQAQLAASTQLEAIREEERQMVEEERAHLTQQMSSLIDAFSRQQQDRLADKLITSQSRLVEATERFERADVTYRDGMDRWAAQDSQIFKKVVDSKEELKNKMKGDWTAINARNSAIQKSTKAVHEETVKIVDAQIHHVGTQMADLDEFVTRARSQNDSHHQAHAADVQQILARARQGFTAIGTEHDGGQADIDDFDQQHQAEMMALGDLARDLVANTREPLRELQDQVSAVALKEYIATGATPQKRDWEYPSHLPQTESHDAIIARLRGLPDPTVAAKGPPPVKTPGRSPRKQMSPRKGAASPSKASSPSKTKVFTDRAPSNEPPSAPSPHHLSATNGPVDQAKTGLKEIDVNVIGRPASTVPGPVAGTHDERPILLDFSKSLGTGCSSNGPPPLKRHATTNAVVESRLPPKLGRARSAVHGAGASMGLPMDVGMENLGQRLGPVASARRLRSSALAE